jgi:hypothetical protein
LLINQIASSVNQSSVLIVQLAILSFDNQVVTLVVYIELSDDVFYIELGNLSHPLLGELDAFPPDESLISSTAVPVVGFELTKDSSYQTLSCVVFIVVRVRA